MGYLGTQSRHDMAPIAAGCSTEHPPVAGCCQGTSAAGISSGAQSKKDCADEATGTRATCPAHSMQMGGSVCAALLLLAATPLAGSDIVTAAVSRITTTAGGSSGGGDPPAVAAARELRPRWPLEPPSLNSSCAGLPAESSCTVRLSLDGQRVMLSVTLPVGVRRFIVLVPKPSTEPSQGTEVYCGGGLVWNGAELVTVGPVPAS